VVVVRFAQCGSPLQLGSFRNRRSSPCAPDRLLRVTLVDPGIASILLLRRKQAGWPPRPPRAGRAPAWNQQQDAGRPWAEAVAVLQKQYPEYDGLIRAWGVLV
jgi:hypothetical protein